MKLKESTRASHIAWSPTETHSCLLACGTAAQQLDASFSTSSTLDLLKLDLNDTSSNELEISSSITSESRFNRLLWNNSILIGGCENSSIYLYDYESNLRVKNRLQKHTSGVVRALDINPFQTNLLASGAGNSEIYIWDLNETQSEPMQPGQKVQPLDDIQDIAWNNQVQHILASTSSGRCVVWDLRKNESIMKISDSVSKLRAKTVAWHPDVATQLCLSSDDDYSPYLQLWDLRFATSPVKILEGHQRGILTFTWCKADSNLLLSSGKDNRILCWNPQTGDIVYEIPNSQWCFDLAWCAHYPHLIASASYESSVSVYTLMGGKYEIKQETSSKIMDSFGVHQQMPLATTSQTTNQTLVIPQLRIAPKWMKQTCGASFGFGGKLVTFTYDKETHENTLKTSKLVNILQVITDTNLVEKSQQLENAISNGQLVDYCNYKIQSSEDSREQELWKFLLACFNSDRTKAFKDNLGFNELNISQKIHEFIAANSNQDPLVDSNSNKNEFDTKFNSQLDYVNHAFDNFQIANRSLSPLSLSFDSDIDNMISQSLLMGQHELAVNLCMSQKRYSDAILIAAHASQDLLKKTQEKYFLLSKNNFSKLLEGFLTHNWSSIIDSCLISNWKEALVAILTYTNEQEMYDLCKTLGNRLENDNSNSNNLFYACICYICSSNLNCLMNCWQKLCKREKNQIEYSAIVQDSIEKAIILRFSHQLTQHSDIHADALNDKLIEYAQLLAEQGCFLTAYNYIKEKNDKSLIEIKNRLYNSIGTNIMQQYGYAKPENPFKSNQSLINTTNLNKNQTQASTPASYLNPSSHLTSSTTINKPYQHPLSQISQINAYNPSNSLPPSVGLLSQKRTLTPTIPQYTPDQFYTPQIKQETQQSNGDNVHKAVSFQNVKQSSGWNDPPMVQAKIKPHATIKESEQEMNYYQPTMPTTQNQPTYTYTQPQPFFNPPPMQHQQNYHHSQDNKPTMTQTGMQPFNNQRPPPSGFTNPTVSQQTHVGIQSFNQPTLKFQQMNTLTMTTSGFFNPQLAPISMPPSTSIQSYTHNTPTSGLFNANTTTTESFKPQMRLNSLPNNELNQFNPIDPTPVNASIQQAKKLESPAPIEKQPLSGEHAIIKNVFDSLLNRCISMANNIANKKKLEDVAKKIEVLYDKLRDKTLSDGITRGIHDITQSIQRYDYNSALAQLTNLIAKSNFSEISGFMPSIKYLIQTSQQMNITF